jgi:signal transduction histidine kinase
MILELSAEEFEFYFRLLWLFVVILFLIVALLYYLYMAMRRARDRESESLAFSRLVIAGQEAERRRISRELHDTVLPELRHLTGTGGGIGEEKTIIRQQEILTGRIRQICMELMPPDFSRLSLGDSLTSLCASFSGRTGIECLPALEPDLDLGGLDPAKQLHLYRMVQEALTNIEKHSGARRAALVVRRVKGERQAIESPGNNRRLLICVSDDGAGLPPEGRPPTGLGMRSMRERAVILGARLDFISESGNGLMVRIEVPLDPV